MIKGRLVFVFSGWLVDCLCHPFACALLEFHLCISFLLVFRWRESHGFMDFDGLILSFEVARFLQDSVHA